MFNFLRSANGFIQKIFIALVIYSLVITLFAVFTRSSNTPTQPTRDINKELEERIYTTINDPGIKSTPAGRTTLVVYRAALCTIVGMACTNNPDDNKALYNHSLIGFMTNAMTIPYTNPPSSGLAWVSQGLQDSGFVPKSYAAEGIGFTSIKGYAQIWSLFRNLTYFILVIIIVTVGFLIMFRVKINPQTVVSIESAIPRIFTTLILITFSFAIAGFLIDLMYISIALGISVLAQLNLPNTELRPDNVNNLIGDYITSQLGGIFPYFKILGQGSLPGSINSTSPLVATGNAFFNLLPSLIKEPLKLVATYFITQSVSKSLTEGVNTLTKPFRDIIGIGDLPQSVGMFLYFIIFYTIVGWMPGIILGFFMIFSLLFLILQIFVLLMASYIRIVLMIVFAPVLIVLEVIPGQHAFSSWMKNLFGELLTFPLIIILTLTGYAIISINYNSQVFILPFLYGLDASSISMISGMAILLISPKLVVQIKQKIGIKGGMPVPITPATFFAPTLGVVQSARMMIGEAFPTLLSGINPASPLVRLLEGSAKNSKGGVLDRVLGSVVRPDSHVPTAQAQSQRKQGSPGSGNTP